MASNPLCDAILVHRDCAGVLEIPSSPGGYQKAFKFRGRAIRCNEYQSGKDRLFLYYDMSLANDEAVDVSARTEKANTTADRKREAEARRRRKGEECLSQDEYERFAPLDVAEALQTHRGNGTFILKTNKGDSTAPRRTACTRRGSTSSSPSSRMTTRWTGRPAICVTSIRSWHGCSSTTSPSRCSTRSSARWPKRS